MKRFCLPLLSLSLASSANAASPISEIICAPREEMTSKLTHQFGETRVATGVRDIERVMEIWTSESSGDWTMLMTYADGNSCIVAMGEHWNDLRPASEKDPT
ncbi:hypothetical protein COL8621_00923 [Actibacterium lipolyticum]|uniref:Uncharacterized protein n=1 Tax=Actibacterium lipolyticum TaxID=1524263 RepID=A0A238JQH8_9RHOB|nr:hypothetical protein COL8621_00923 [Actibacterium lipolyticum]